ncbi:hypothetical protein Plhal304r1_c031g0101341 [Plasmopara halstedii]
MPISCDTHPCYQSTCNPVAKVLRCSFAIAILVSTYSQRSVTLNSCTKRDSSKSAPRGYRLVLSLKLFQQLSFTFFSVISFALSMIDEISSYSDERRLSKINSYRASSISNLTICSSSCRGAWPSLRCPPSRFRVDNKLWTHIRATWFG